MRYEKTLFAPEEKYFTERVDPSKPKAGQKVSLYHMRPTSSGIVCGEGNTEIATLPAAGSRLFATDGGVYAYLSGKKMLYDVTTMTPIAGIDAAPRAVLSHSTDTGVKGIYCVGENGAYYIRGDSVIRTFGIGGTCAAMHHGRLFAADGKRLRFSAPFSIEGVTQTGKDPDGAGYVDFEDGKGDIVALISFRERLYVFFERGIMRMRAEGEALDFAATEMPFAGGSVLPRSAAACGEQICYLTEKGLFAFDGNSCSLLEQRDEIDPNSAVSGDCYGGNYAAVVGLKNGRKVVYVYDFEEKSGRFLIGKGLSAGARENFLAGTAVYKFNRTGGLPLGFGCIMEVTVPAPLLKLAWMRIDGEGTFEISVNGGDPFPAKGGDGVRIDGKERTSETTVSITSEQPNFCIRALEFAWRKEDGDRHY